MREHSNLVDEKGFVSDEGMEIVKAVGPVYCVDAVLIPESNTPQVILFKRDGGANSDIYWIVGGRQRLGESMEHVAERKIRSESGLKVAVNWEDQLFTYDIFHVKNKEGNWVTADKDSLPKDVREIYHTPATCYMASVGPYEEIETSLKGGDGNGEHKLFTEIDSNWDPYIQKVVRAAWKKKGFKDFD